ncbi:MAG: hypothetical protein R3D00_18160 [Bacteroidia bacterium]
MSFRQNHKQSIQPEARLTVKRALARTGGVILVALAATFFVASPDGTGPGLLPQGSNEQCAISAQPDQVSHTVTIAFTLSGERDMALQILDPNRNEIMSRLFTPTPPNQQVTLTIDGWPKGKYTARLYNHRQAVSYEFEIGPGEITGR